MSTPKASESDSVEAYKFLRGTIARFTYRNAENGFSVVRLEPEEDLKEISGNTVTLVGVISGSISTGSTVIARGEWSVHPKFGRQFKARSVTETEPTSAEAIERYLGSGAIKGFGPVLARRIVEEFGTESLKILDEDPSKLSRVPGVGRKKLAELTAAWKEKANQREVMLFFQNYNLSISLSQRLFKHYGNKTIEVVKANPYILVQDIWGIGFGTADKIALTIGIDPRAQQRVIAALCYTIKSAADDGHCFLPTEKLLSKASSILGIEDSELLEECLKHALFEALLIEEENRIYSPLLYKAELDLSKLIAKKYSPATRPDKQISADLLQDVRAKPIEVRDSKGAKLVHLSEEQKSALDLISNNLLTIITGGPGCGKTTVVRAVSNLFKRAGLTFKLAAPTGRAAQRLGEVCRMESSTIHRLLKYDPVSRGFVHDEDNQLPIDAIILDECSMIDVHLAASVFKAVSANTRVVLVGDADQLPSVGPGLFLGDLLTVPEVTRVNLTQLFRRQNESSINEVAHSINLAEVPKIPEPDGQTKSDSYFIKASEPSEAADMIERLVSDQIPKRFAEKLALKTSDVLVLSPMNKGELGVVTLNQKLQNRLIPEDSKKSKVRCGDLEFYFGDRVVQRVNNYNLDPAGVFNGDQGIVTAIDPAQGTLTVKLWDGRKIEYSSDTLHQLDLAYALTIHRAQGSEVPVVVLAMHDSHNIMLERQLFYTAVTRAKKLLIVVGTRRSIAIATKRLRSKRRYSNLAEKVKSLLS